MLRQDQQQVNADRLERFVLENLKRVSRDEPYIENLCFRLNHNPIGLPRSIFSFLTSLKKKQEGFIKQLGFPQSNFNGDPNDGHQKMTNDSPP